MQQVTLLVLLFAIVYFNDACYITNCPIGGKRSADVDNSLHRHQCPRCGLGGQCFGPSICCTGLACRIGHPSDVRQCSSENHDLTPCVISSAACSAVPNGRCAARSVCCNTDSCEIDDACLPSSNQENEPSREERLAHVRFALS